VAAKVLVNLSISLNKVRSAVEFIIGHGEASSRAEVGLSPGAKRVIELAIDEARYIGHNYIGTEHLLLGLLREGEGIAARVLDSLGVTLEKVRAEITRVQEQGVSRAKPARSPSRTPALDHLGMDLTASARSGNLIRYRRAKKSKE
jgi:ATP-dependent Clp protease ATP-binding subunit ClpC